MFGFAPKFDGSSPSMPKSIFPVAVDPLFELRVPTVEQLVWHKCRKGYVEERYIQQRVQNLHSASWIIDSAWGEGRDAD